MAQWEKITSRGNVSDRRTRGQMAVFGGGMGLTGIAVLLLVNYLAGGNVMDVLTQVDPSAFVQEQQVERPEYEGEDAYEVFASTVLGSNNEMWARVFAEEDQRYAAPQLVLFREMTQSGCGGASSQHGPHYCPADGTIYLDETFFDELKNRFGAQGGDVAEAYVIAHEVGHHVQNELGIIKQIRPLQERNPDKANDLSVKLELQADCFAGLWANSIKDRGVFLPGEINEAIDAAEAVGDDRIQKTVNGYVSPESWTHGSSEQRVEWFNRGFETGRFEQCDTFN